MMPQMGILVMLAFAGLLGGQQGQQGSRPGWPCVAGRAVDPSYIDISESSGGQLFLFQKGEVAQSSAVMSAPYTHPSTVMRAIGHLSGDRDFEFPVDSTMGTILVLASMQCRKAILVTRPGGQELTSANSAQMVELQTGRIHRIDLPEPGVWKVRLSGTGLFVLSVLTKSDVSIGGVRFLEATGDGARLMNPLRGVRQRLEAHVGGQVSNVNLQMVDPTGNPIADLDAPEPGESGAYRTTVTPLVERFRIRISGTDAAGWPFQRTEPVLFRAGLPK